MAGLIRVRSIGAARRRAGFAFSPDWTPIAGGQIDEAQFLAILKDQDLVVERSSGEEDWHPFQAVDVVIEALQDHVDYDLAHARPHDLAGSVDNQKFHDAQGAEGRTETGAPVSGAPDAKDGAGDVTAPSADPLGGAEPAAGDAQESREGTDEGTARDDAPAAGENQPEESLTPPVAAQHHDKPTGDKPKKGIMG